MAGKQSKTKGANGERELAKILSAAFDASFIRSDNSGAFIGGKNIGRKVSLSDIQKRVRKADIIPPDHLPHLVVESKSYKTFNFHALIQAGPYPLLDDWINQTISVIDPGDQWFVAFKIVRRGWYLAIPETECHDYVFGNYCAYTGTHATVRITDLVSFFRTNKDTVIQKASL